VLVRDISEQHRRAYLLALRSRRFLNLYDCHSYCRMALCSSFRRKAACYPNMFCRLIDFARGIKSPQRIPNESLKRAYGSRALCPTWCIFSRLRQPAEF
jgi:hypothetical protein